MSHFKATAWFVWRILRVMWQRVVIFNRLSDLSPWLFNAAGARQNLIFIFDIFDNRGDGSNLQNFQAHIKLRSAVFLKVQREVTALIRINISKSSWSPWLLWQITEEWIDKTHLHCSEMAGWSNLKRKIPFTRLKYNLLSHISQRKNKKNSQEHKKQPWSVTYKHAIETQEQDKSTCLCS